ncbi:MAG: hypothetical protein LUF01_04620 [Bacteroides sp.]|nr:hypothetical protein [Bacteroides sp.]
MNPKKHNTKGTTGMYKADSIHIALNMATVSSPVSLCEWCAPGKKGCEWVTR